MKIMNLTPHPFNLFAADAADPKGTLVPGAEPVLVIASSGIARCSEVSTSLTAVEMGDISVPTACKHYGELTGLPDPEEGTVYVTSALAALKAWQLGRIDVYVPDLPVRDAEGKILGCRGLAGNPSLG